MARSALLAVLATAIGVCTMDARADTLIIEGLDSGRQTVSERPSRGMSMEKVEGTWGQPQDRQNAVGDPPISRWEYPEFIVYFEYTRVIHAVRKL
jgi:hypothetical protein